MLYAIAMGQIITPMIDIRVVFYQNMRNYVIVIPLDNFTGVGTVPHYFD